MVKNSNTCKKAVTQTKKFILVWHVIVASDFWMYCSFYLFLAITGIKELGMNSMLLCNNCVEENEIDNFIRCRSLAQVAEKIDSLDLW